MGCNCNSSKKNQISLLAIYLACPIAVMYSCCKPDKDIVHKAAQISVNATVTRLPYGFSNIPWASKCCFMDTILQIIAAWCPEDVREGSPLKTIIEKINNGCKVVTSADVREFKQGLSGKAKNMVKEGKSEGGDEDSFLYALHDKEKDLLLDKYILFSDKYLVVKDEETAKRLHARHIEKQNYLKLGLYPGDPRLAHSVLTIEDMIDAWHQKEVNPRDFASGNGSISEFVGKVVEKHKDKRLRWFLQEDLDMNRLPAKLIVYMHRFAADRKRIGGEMQDPSTICIGHGREKIIYHLKAFSVHDFDRNHVTACIKRKAEWYEVDDWFYDKPPTGGIQPLQPQDIVVKVQNARLLFYERS